jgi:FAS-associated factor 2
LRFLLVYLHNEDDPTSVQFANNVICTNLLKSVVEDNLLFWSCSVKKREGECVSESLNKAKAPFMALLCFKEGQMRMVYKHQGPATVEHVISRLTTSIVENEPHLNRQRSSRNRDRVSESTSSQLLMQEQDAAYQESLIRDQERVRKKEEEERAVRMIQEEQERLEKEKQDKVAARLALRQKLKENLPEQTKEDTLALLFRLPNGTRVSRKFSPIATIKDVYDFALTCDESPNFFTLVSNFPKRVLPVEGDAHQKTCEEMGIQSSTTLFVQEIVSDDEESSSSEAEM